MTLYSASLSMFGAKVQIALIEKGADYQLVMVPYDRDRGSLWLFFVLGLGQRFYDPIEQVSGATAVVRGNGDRVAQTQFVEFHGRVAAGHAVGLVGDQNSGFVGSPQHVGDFMVSRVDPAARVDHEYNDIGLADSGVGLLASVVGNLGERVGLDLLVVLQTALFPSLPAATLLSPYLGTPHAHPKHPPSGPPPAPPTPCPSLGVVLLGASVNVLINNLPAARCDDIGLAPTCCAIPPAWFRIMMSKSISPLVCPACTSSGCRKTPCGKGANA